MRSFWSSAGDLPSEAELAVEKLLNVVEALHSDKQSLVDEVERLRKQLDKKKKPPHQNLWVDSYTESRALTD